jgi:hypothetical protein
MKEIKSKREQIPANAFRTSIQSPLRPMAHVATRHSTQFVPPHNLVSQAQKKKLNPMPQNATFRHVLMVTVTVHYMIPVARELL